MRKLAAAPALALALALVAALGAFGPAVPVPSASAATQPKVVIIVGAVHGSTDRFRTNANADYAEAIKYTSNVVKVYSPNATWAAVKAAVAGASVVIYRGHGNGWPSPYTYDPNYTTKDGFGLNAVAGQGDYNNKYYGEPYIDDLQFAPNAVVLLHGLCYASGNGEPGQPEPTVSVAKQRADNYASAFLKAGAAAVIAGGKESAGYYLKGLFTTRQTLDQMWRAAPTANDNTFSFASVRRPGRTVQMDPETPTTGYYRSIAGSLSVRTEHVTGTVAAPTDPHPSTFVIPGAASVAVDAAPVWPTTAMSPASAPTELPRDTRVRVLAKATGPAGATIFEVSTLDGATAGWVHPASLVPRDSVPPTAWTVNTPTSIVSPNADGIRDTFSIDGRLSESASWRVRFTIGGSVVAETAGDGTEYAASWDAWDGDRPVADGTYAWTLDVWDDWGNAAEPKTGKITVDTTLPTVKSLSLSTSTFTPNGDGVSDSLGVTGASSEAGELEIAIRDSQGTAVRTLRAAAGGGSATATWDGRNATGALVADGTYRLDVSARDGAGNTSEVTSRDVNVYGALRSVVRSTSIFYPQDSDTLAKSSKLSFTLLRPATVTWEITKADGTVVLTRYSKRALPAGTYSYTWTGRDAAGALLPKGKYYSRVHATNGTLTAVQRASLEMNAFAVTVSDTTPKRGQTITVYGRSAEGLSRTPRVRVEQPGIARFTVTMVRTSGSSYKASVKFKSSSAGKVRLRVSSYDTYGRFQYTYLTLPLS